MFQSVICASQPWRTLVERVEKSLTGLCLALGVATVGTPLLPVYGSEVSRANPAQPEILAAQVAHRQLLSDGVYLYGQSSEPNQVGSAYMVFEVKQGQIVGAFYMPYSSFDCFHGNFEADRVALTVIDSYEQTPHPYSIALQPTDAVASTGEESVPMTLEGYHRIESISSNDQRILSTCQADYRNQG